ncbi:hypothetical protein BU17DRAFT_68935 [Hysterangium stoloniferum]|nr:hypothetical protein BU17DRAFT_68935 [Hysterangium stoloniferum]
MEAKLKSLRVPDLRELLSKASVTVPAKAKKEDLIAKILASPAALEAFGHQEAPNGEKRKVTAPPQSGVDDDLLAPPEEFDWDPSADASSAKPAEITAKTAPPPVPAPAPTAAVAAPPSTTKTITTTTSKPEAATTTAAQDDELEKRRKRAARFGIPLVEPKGQKREQKPAPGANGAKAPRAAPRANLTAQEAEKAAARAARFGMPNVTGAATATTAASVVPTTAAAVTPQKRARSPAAVDKEEMERRKKRAERFSSGGEAKAQA